MDQDDVKNVLAAATKAVDDANVPQELRSLAFERAIDLLSRSSAPLPAALGGLPSGTETGTPPSHPAESPLNRVATRLRLQRDAVEAVYTDDGAEVEVSVPTDRLSAKKSTATREIALLVAAARQANGEEYTPSEAIRTVAQDYDRFDGPNFASALNEMKGTFLATGTPRNRSFKLTKPGWKAATDLVTRIANTANGS